MLQGFLRLLFWQFLPPKTFSGLINVRGKCPEQCIYDQSKMIFIYLYGFLFWCISGLKGKNYQYFGSSFNVVKTTNPWLLIKNPFTPHRESLGPSFKSHEGKSWCLFVDAEPLSSEIKSVSEWTQVKRPTNNAVIRRRELGLKSHLKQTEMRRLILRSSTLPPLLGNQMG